MNRITIYRWSVLVLLILNLGTLGLVLSNPNWKSAEPPPSGPLQLFKKLNLSTKTFEKIQQLGGNHHHQIQELNFQEQDLIYTALVGEEKEQIESQIAQIERLKIQVTREHFLEIESLLNDEQKELFKAIKKELITALFKNQGPPRPKPFK